MVIIRKAAAAGRFYPRFKHDLMKQINDSFLDKEFGVAHTLEIGDHKEKTARTVIGGICPHAGYIYSGAALTHTIQRIYEEGAPETIIILGTRHTNYYKTALMKNGLWETPLGQVEIDTEVAEKILQQGTAIIEDDSAFNGYPHGREHNIEVQIPFLQYATEKAKSSFKLVPIKIGEMDPAKLQKIASMISEAIKQFPNKDIVVLASSDMTHYQPRNPTNPTKEIEENQYKKDQAVIDAFKANDWSEVYTAANRTSVCGPQTMTTFMLVANNLGYNQPEALKYYTSFDKGGRSIPCDYSVGYFSGVMKK